MLREGPRLRASAWDAGEWLHTAVYTALPGHRAILFPGSPYDDEIIDTIVRRGGAVIVLPAPSGSTPLDAAVVGLSSVERLAATVWARASATDA
jgi:hypothetical protein